MNAVRDIFNNETRFVCYVCASCSILVMCVFVPRNVNTILISCERASKHEMMAAEKKLEGESSNWRMSSSL